MADVSITAANVLPGPNARTSQVIAGASITAGAPVYQNPADSKYYVCDNNASAASAAVVGIAATSAPGAGQLLVIVLQDAAFTPGFTIAAGAVAYTSGNAGAITVTAADNVTGMFVGVLGIGIGSNKMVLSPTYSTAAM